MRSLTEIQRKAPEAILADLRSDSRGVSGEAGMRMVSNAKEYGLGLRDYLTLAIDPRQSEEVKRYETGEGKLLTGYEAALLYLNLPVRQDLEHGIVLQAASETFQTFPGTRALFPEVIDDMVRWKYRQDLLETVTPLIGSSRTINQVEMISTVVDDKADDYKHAQSISEMARIPVRSIRTTQTQVGIWKFGLGYRTSYEFERRASLDLLTPYAARAQRELEIQKVAVATDLLVNGDSVHTAAGVAAQTSYVASATAGKINYTALLMWLVERAQAGVPVDTVVGNWDAYIQWLLLFTIPTTANVTTDAELLAKGGFQIGGVPVLRGSVNFALSSTAPAGKLIGYSKADTLEELNEAGSLINESERSVSNQTITYYKTENKGYRLVFGDTRSIYDFGVAE